MYLEFDGLVKDVISFLKASSCRYNGSTRTMMLQFLPVALTYAWLLFDGEAFEHEKGKTREKHSEHRSLPGLRKAYSGDVMCRGSHPMRCFLAGSHRISCHGWTM